MTGYCRTIVLTAGFSRQSGRVSGVPTRWCVQIGSLIESLANGTQ